MLALVNECPTLLVAGHSFAQVTWISYGKFNQFYSPGRLEISTKTLVVAVLDEGKNSP
jgi:hypothetical protein